MPDSESKLDAHPVRVDRDSLVDFHLHGDDGAGGTGPLHPAAAESLDGRLGYPLVLLDGEGATAAPLAAVISQALETLRLQGGTAPLLAAHESVLLGAIAGHARGDGPARLVEVLDGAARRLEDAPELAGVDPATLREELARLEATLPGAGALVDCTRSAPIELYLAAARRARDAAATTLEGEVRSLAARLDELLASDRRHRSDAGTPQGLTDRLGRPGQELFDAEALSRLLPHPRGPRRLDDDRRARIERAAGVFSAYLAGRDRKAGITLVHREPWTGGPVADTVTLVEAPDPLGRAASLYDTHVRSFVELLRAIRLARLELDGSYRAGRHDRALERFDWRAASPAERRMLPRIAVLETTRQVQDGGMGALGELLGSGRPVDVLLLEDPLRRQTRADTAAHVEIGYQAAAQRDAFVLQSTLAAPVHLVTGLDRLVACGRPSVAVLAVPNGGEKEAAAVELVAWHRSRATPCFVYDPGGGDTWASCLELADNPEPERPWPLHAPVPRAAGDAPDGIEEAFTPAHAAALDPELRGHFRVIPDEAWGERQLDLASFLELDAASRRRRLPFIWTRATDGRLQRAIVTHELAEACRERMRTWRILVELAGIRNEHAERAIQAVRSDTQSRSERSIQELTARQEHELAAVRAEAERAAVQRVLAILIDPAAAVDAAPVHVPLPADRNPLPVINPAPADVARANESPAAVATVTDEPPATIADPYIDSALCTTCNECTNLNPRLFRYNEDKQAFIADASAGTFKELVKAAEKCPARCIHPGAPRPGDRTANEALLRRAAKFN